MWRIAFILLLLAPTVSSETRVVVRGAELSKSPLGPLLTVAIAPLSLEGKLLSTEGLQVNIGSSPLPSPPILVTRQDSTRDLALIVVLQTAGQEKLIQTLQDSGLPWPKGARLSLIEYSDAVAGGHQFSDADVFLDALSEAEPSELTDAPQLLAAVHRGVSAAYRYQKKHPTTDVSVLVLSDGLTEDQQPADFFEAARRAKKRGIRIHTIGFSESDFRTPLLGLGTLSKLSGGTFRWLRSSHGLAQNLKNLFEEEERHYLLRIFLGNKNIKGKPLYVTLQEQKSDRFVVKEYSCSGTICSDTCIANRCSPPQNSDQFPWRIILIAIAAIVGLVITVYLLKRMPRRNKSTGPSRGSLILLTGDSITTSARHGATIGTGKKSDLRVPPFPGVAETHIRLEAQKGGALAAVDVSGLGFKVNGISVSSKVLNHGVTIQIGNVSIRYWEGA